MLLQHLGEIIQLLSSALFPCGSAKGLLQISMHVSCLSNCQMADITVIQTLHSKLWERPPL